MALCSAAAFLTPLGLCPVATEILETLSEFPGVRVLNEAFQREHSLEVHLPFLQTILGEFEIVPIVVGQCSGNDVATVLRNVWGGPETCIVISSDLSHFHPDYEARRIDAMTSTLIESGRIEELTSRHACGYLPIQGLLTNTASRGLKMKAIDLRNSSQTVGNPDRVVGYGAFISEGIEPSAVESTAAAGLAAAAQPPVPPVSMYTTGLAAPWLAVREPEQLVPRTPELAVSLTQGEQALLLRAAVEAIAQELRTGRPAAFDNPGKFSPALLQPAGAFVTLKKQGALRGCVGTIEAKEPLIANIVRSAGNAAFRDSRFPPLTRDELGGLQLHLSILSKPQAMTFEGEWDLIRQLRPKTDGLILRAGGRSAVFLPSVWEEITSPRDFVARLKRKAGLNPDVEYPDLTAERFTAYSVEGTIRDADASPGST